MQDSNSIEPDLNVSSKQEGLLVLSVHQEALFGELSDKQTEMGTIYRGALRVLSDAGNADSYSLAAHNLRELMDKLPAHIGVDITDWRIHLSHKLDPLSEAWATASKSSPARKASKNWSGKIDQHLRKFLSQTDEFFEWLLEHRPRRRAVVGRALLELEPADIQPPKTVQEIGISEWMDYYNYFVSVAHHRDFSKDEYESILFGLEHYLLDRLRPRVFEGFQEIQELIDKGELSDNT